MRAAHLGHCRCTRFKYGVRFARVLIMNGQTELERHFTTAITNSVHTVLQTGPNTPTRHRRRR